MAIARQHQQRRITRGTWKPRFTKQRRNWRGTAKATVTPTLASIAPSTVVMGAANTTVTLTGTGFVSGVTIAMIDGDDVATTFVSATSLTIVIPAALLAAAATMSINVHSGFLVSTTPRTFTVTATGEIFSVSAHTIAEVEEYVDANPEQADEVLAAEQDGQARVTLINWLQGFISDRDAGHIP
jgi:hypothetical protein